MTNRFRLYSNGFLKQAVDGFFHTEFGGEKYSNNPNFLYTFKNDPHHNWSSFQLQSAKRELKQILHSDFPEILHCLRSTSLTVCVVPRAKADHTYRPDQLLFRDTVSECAREIEGVQDGTSFISRMPIRAPRIFGKQFMAIKTMVECRTRHRSRHLPFFRRNPRAPYTPRR